MKGYFGNKKVQRTTLGTAILYNLVERPNVVGGKYLDGVDTTAAGRDGSSTSFLTNWIPVSPNTTYKLNAPDSNRRVLQARNSSGVIRYMINESVTKESSHDYVLTTGATDVEIRVYFIFGWESTTTSPDFWLTYIG